MINNDVSKSCDIFARFNETIDITSNAIDLLSNIKNNNRVDDYLFTNDYDLYCDYMCEFATDTQFDDDYVVF
ncbi:MAG: hypothetical protein HFI87_02045 [Bacilli bacterium]|nr:hypothetical protein [Bacilli bacterium]